MLHNELVNMSECLFVCLFVCLVGCLFVCVRAAVLPGPGSGDISNVWHWLQREVVLLSAFPLNLG